MGEGELCQCIEKRRPNTNMGEAEGCQFISNKRTKRPRKGLEYEEDEKAEEELYQRIKKKRQKRRSKAEEEWYQYIKNKRARRNSISIPLHIIFDIHTRLPVKSLLRFKSACKSWRALISNPLFATSHVDRQSKKKDRPCKTVLIPLLRGDQMEISIYTLNVDSIVATFLYRLKCAQQPEIPLPPHCNGLLLLSTNRLHVCNPSTGELITLPEGSPTIYRHGRWAEDGGLAFVSSTNHYKVVRHFYRSYDHKARCCSIGFEVLTLGVDDSWRATIEDPPYPIKTGIPACVGEDIYWEIDNSLHSKAPQAILGFNASQEIFTPVPGPSGSGSPDFSKYGCVLLAELEGSLGLVYSPIDIPKVDLWIYKGGGNCSWVHNFSIELQRKPQCFVPLIIQHEKILLQIDNTLQYYNCQSKSLELPLVHITKELLYYTPQKRPPYSRPYSGSVFIMRNYVESLVSFGNKSLELAAN